MTLNELLEKLEEINIDNYNKDTEELYRDIINNVIDYENDNQDFDLEYIYEDIIDYDTAEEIAKSELDKGGLIRLYYFLGDANLNNSIFHIDGYGNLEDFDREDVRYLKEELIDEIKRKMDT